MKIKLFFAAVCILILPFVFSSTVDGKRTNPNQLNMAALAGHIIPGNYYCECGAPQCFCEPGEMRTASQPALSQATDGTRSEATTTSEGDFSAGVMLITLIVVMGLRVRF